MNEDTYGDDFINSMFFEDKPDLKDKLAAAVKKVNTDSTRSKKNRRAAEEAVFGGNSELEAFKILVRMFLNNPTDEDLYNELIKELNPDKKSRTPADIIMDSMKDWASNVQTDAFFDDVYIFHGITFKKEDKK